MKEMTTILLSRAVPYVKTNEVVLKNVTTASGKAFNGPVSNPFIVLGCEVHGLMGLH